MPLYDILKCSVCLREKNVLQDQVHASPNLCNITKGCSGILYPVGESTVFTPTPSVPGLTNWYPLGQKPTVVPAPIPVQTVDLSTSGTGVLTIGLNIPGSVSSPPPSVVVLSLSQQLTQNVSYTEYIYQIASTTTSISGQDSTGKNLRFTSANVTAGLVVVLVNGVASFPGTGWTSTTANTITFNTQLTAGTIVTVSVYSQPPTFTINLIFHLNQNLTLTDSSGAWANVRWVEEYDPTTGSLKPNKWWLYSCSGTDVLSKSSRLSLLGAFSNSSPSYNSSANVPLVPPANSTDFSGLRFFLASPPYDNPDRYLNFYVDGAAVGNEYALLTSTASITELFADSSALVEMYPPFQLIYNPSSPGVSSFVSPDVFPSNDSSSSTTLLTGTKILGPV